MESLNYSKEKKKEFRIKFVKRNSFQCDKRYFCKQIEKQMKFIIDILKSVIVTIDNVKRFVTEISLIVYFETFLRIVRPFSRIVNKTNFPS